MGKLRPQRKVNPLKGAQPVSRKARCEHRIVPFQVVLSTYEGTCLSEEASRTKAPLSQRLVFPSELLRLSHTEGGARERPHHPAWGSPAPPAPRQGRTQPTSAAGACLSQSARLKVLPPEAITDPPPSRSGRSEIIHHNSVEN